MNRRLLMMGAAALLLAGCFGGGPKRAPATITDSRYTHQLHNRFYAAWVQPEIVAAPRGKISVPADVEIARSGRVLRFEIAQPSGYRELDDSVRRAGRSVREVAPPPLIGGAERLRLRVYFDLDVKG